MILRIDFYDGFVLETVRWSISSLDRTAQFSFCYSFRLCQDDWSIPSQRPKAVTFEFVVGGSVCESVQGEVVESRHYGGNWYLVVESSEINLLRLSFIELLEAGSTAVEWRNLPSEADRFSWLEALWFRYASSRRSRMDFDATVQIALSPSQFTSKAAFYCFMGEAAFGYGGYAGMSLDGLSEVLEDAGRQGWRCSVRIDDPLAVASLVVDWLSDGRSFLDVLRVVLENCGVSVEYENRGFGVLTVPAGNAQSLLDSALSADVHCANVSDESDPEL